MNLCVLLGLALCVLMARPAQAQATEITPTDFFPLEVGNQWTYRHGYDNVVPLDIDIEPRALFEIPSYLYENHEYPPRFLRHIVRELTVEITHTEMIDGLEYFVFSRAEYDWPPVPKLFWAGQKVRLSDEGVLLFRWNGQDVPLYDFNPPLPNKYSIPAYPIWENISTKLDVRHWSMGKFTFSYPEFHEHNERYFWEISVNFLAGYGGGVYWEDYYKITGIEGFFREAVSYFHHGLQPISAIISGEAVSYQQVRFGNTHVQSSSWGQLKRSFRPR